MSDMMVDGQQQSHEITMTNAATTIDPNVVQSRILQSSSLAAAAARHNDSDSDDDEMGEEGQQPTFAKLSAMADRGGKVEYRRVRCPKHRYTPLREDWEQILMPLVQFLKLQVCQKVKILNVTTRLKHISLMEGILSYHSHSHPFFVIIGPFQYQNKIH